MLGRVVVALSGGEEANDAVGAGEGDGDGGAGAFFGCEGKRPSVFLDDAAHDEQPQSVSLFLGGAEGFIHGSHYLV